MNGYFKVSLITFLILLTIGTAVFIVVNKQRADGKITIKIAIYPTGMLDETYYFTLKGDLLESSLGVRKNDNLETTKFLSSIKKTQKRKLNKQEIKNFIGLADALQLNGYNGEKNILTDSWDISILYKAKMYEANYHINECEALENLIEELIKLSPITVNLREFS